MRTMTRRLCAILCAALLAGALVPIASAATFTDTTGHWAAAQIENCAGRGIVDGVGGGRFEPEGKVTNAQFTKMLCSAFYAAEELTFENENRAAIDNYFGGSVQWYAYKSYYFQKLGLLNNVDYDILSAASASQPMNRNNMAQVAANVLTQKGIIASEDDKALAQATLSLVNDYYTIPESNRDAVKTCYALSIITGTDGGKFDGGSTMTRAQACTVITRLLDVVAKGPTGPVPSQPDVPTEKDITVTAKTYPLGTAWCVTDNGFPTGYLNNGKEINEANVKELLEKAKAIWPTGMTWTTAGTANNNWYEPTGTASINMPMSSNYECSGFAKMLSYYLFGKNANPVHVVTNLADIRPGDIIVSNTLNHDMICIGTVQSGSRTGAVFAAEGNLGTHIKWADTNNNWDARDAATLGTFTIYSRYPD